MGVVEGKVVDREVLEERARNLGARNLNGIARLFVSLLPPAAPTEAWLDVDFHTPHHLAAIVTAIGGGTPPHAIFPISGGVRLRGGASAGQVRVTSVTAGPGTQRLRLRVVPIGDYSTYQLAVQFAGFDPVMTEIDFKFRPACFNLNCAGNDAEPAPLPLPDIDYLAKDFDSFKHVLICAMQARVPGWAPTSEADLDQVLIDLLAADADELSDFQDRVMSEATLGNARKRVSLARHARLMDYHIHQGNQASGWLALMLDAATNALVVPAGVGAWTGADWRMAGSEPFMTRDPVDCRRVLNELTLYSWGGTITALEIGSTRADVALPVPLDPTAAADAIVLRDLLNSGQPRRLLVQQKLNPETGNELGRDPTARQLLELLGDAEAIFDPMAGVAGEWCVRVHWREDDRLTRRYCFSTQCDLSLPLRDVSLFHGNLVPIHHGRPHRTVFRAPGAALAIPDPLSFLYTDEAHFETTPWGALATLPHTQLAYRDTPPGGERPPNTTLTVTVAGFGAPWVEQSDLIESPDDAEHFIVETDEYRVSRLRFGNGRNGGRLPDNAVATCLYQVGDSIAGNVGADSLTGFDRVALPQIAAIWNPFDFGNGRLREPVAEIVRRVPEAYRMRQLRAVTLGDYARRAEELPEVAHAHASYAWTGSWRTVRIAIDPRGGTGLAEPVRQRIANHIEAVRLIGEDIEVRAATYVPLDVFVRVCAHPDYWPEDLRRALELEFSDGWTPDRRPGLFNPDLWTFGQPLYASQIIGRALSVPGVGRVLLVGIRRLHGLHGPSLQTITVAPGDDALPAVGKVDVRPSEILQVANDPSRLETGRLNFEILGGRR
jgi:Baseplate J-like protein